MKNLLKEILGFIIRPFIWTWIWNYEPFKTINRIYSLFFEDIIKTKHWFIIKAISDDVLIKRTLIEEWEWENSITKLFYKILKKWDTFIDVWANIWYYTILWSKIVWDNWIVISIEPSKKIFNILDYNVNINWLNNVTLNNVWVWDETKELELFYCKENPWKSSIVNNSLKKNKKELIKIVKLDDLYNKKVDLVKMDIEGFEYEWLLWMTNIFENNLDLKIIFEFSPQFYYSDKKSVKILELLQYHWYYLFDINNNFLNIENIVNFSKNLKSQTDILCIKDLSIMKDIWISQ